MVGAARVVAGTAGGAGEAAGGVVGAVGTASLGAVAVVVAEVGGEGCFDGLGEVDGVLGLGGLDGLGKGISDVFGGPVSVGRCRQGGVEVSEVFACGFEFA
jgi:hypothetical protein